MPSPRLPIFGRQGGFTLIEVMVVVVILSILAAVVVPRIMSRPDEARITKAKQDLRALEAALNLYRLDNYRYPTTEQGLEALVEKPSIPPVPPTGRKAATSTACPKTPGVIRTTTSHPASTGRSTCTPWAPTASPAAKG